MNYVEAAQPVELQCIALFMILDRRYSEDIANGIYRGRKDCQAVYYYNRKERNKTWSKGALYGKGEIIPAFLRNTSLIGKEMQLI